MPALEVAAIYLTRDLLQSLHQEAEAEGLTLHQLAAAKLSVPLATFGRVVTLKCAVCGRPWLLHDASCSNHRLRPDWSKGLDDAD